jgi:hypothetical protein
MSPAGDESVRDIGRLGRYSRVMDDERPLGPPPPLARPEVAPKHRGVRPVFWLALALALTIAVLIATRLRSRDPISTPLAGDWFSQHRAHCNAVEAVTYLQTNDPGPGFEGRKFRAGCLALAGKIQAARTVILEAPGKERYHLTNYVFSVGHPVADQGDDESAGPIMELVIEFQPDQYMALYHAGMAQAIAGNDERARKHLTRFLEIYTQPDGWTSNAKRALQSLERPRAKRTVEPGHEGNVIY